MFVFRFNFGDSRNVVVRTHRQNGGFGNEERHATFFPFVPGQPFEIIIKAEHDKYMVGWKFEFIYITSVVQITLHMWLLESREIQTPNL